MMEDEPSTDQIIAEAQGTSDQAPTDTPNLQEPPPPEGQAPVQQFEYSANGKTIKEPLDVILKRASQGYNYAQHMADHKIKSEQVDSRFNSAVELENKYGEIDKYASDNPEWNDHLHKSWDNRFDISGGQANQETQQQQGVPEQFQKEFNSMKDFVEGIKAERADAAYDGAVGKVKDAYPDIDFAATDPDSGKTLEQQVLDYAQDNSIGKFEPAFKAFHHDSLIERARNSAKDQMAGDLKQRARAGLLGTSQTPSPSNASSEMPANFKGMSHNELHNWIVDKYT
mgnify:CR=1 FL=1